MKRSLLTASVVFVWACGPSYGGQDVKTPDEWIEEQERLAAEEERKREARGETLYADEDTDEEKKKKFDRRQAKMELQRATRSAVQCPSVVQAQEGENPPRGTMNVSITFQEDGSVSDVGIPSPFTDTPVGDCVKNAYDSVIVPPFVGGSAIVDWEVTIEDPKEGEGDEKEEE